MFSDSWIIESASGASDNEDEDYDYVRDNARHVEALRKNSHSYQKKVSKKMVDRHRKKNPVSIYNVGEKVLVQNPKSKTRRGKRVLDEPAAFEGYITSKRGTNYQLQYDGDYGEHLSGWFGANNIASLTKEEENRRRKLVSSQNQNTIESMEALRENLLEYGLAPVETEGDGNCFFRAVSRMVFANDEHYETLRARAVQHISSNREDFEHFLSHETFEQFIYRISQDGAWADDAVIRATADALEVEIFIISNDSNYVPRFQPPNPTQTIFLGHIRDMHYVSTTHLEDVQYLRSGGRTTNGVCLNNTSSVDNPLTWTFNILKMNPEIKPLFERNKISKQLLKLLKDFENGNSANAKRSWYGTLKKRKDSLHDSLITFNAKDSDTFSQLIKANLASVITLAHREITVASPFLIVHGSGYDLGEFSENLTFAYKNQNLTYSLSYIGIEKELNGTQYSSFTRYQPTKYWYEMDTMREQILTKRSILPIYEWDYTVSIVVYFCLAAIACFQPKKGPKIDVFSHRGRSKKIQFVKRKELDKYIEYDRTKQKAPGKENKEYLAALEESIMEQGLVNQLFLAVSKKTGRAYLTEGNHRMVVLKKFNVEWVPVEVTYQFYNDDEDSRYAFIPGNIPKDEYSWPEEPTPEKMGFDVLKF